MPRGKYVNHKGRNRHFTSPEELEQERKKAAQKKREKAENGEGSESSDEEEPEKSSAESGASDDEEEDSEDDGTKKAKGVQGIIEIENPNRVQKKVAVKVSTTTQLPKATELTRREREELEKQQAAAKYQKLHSEGKTAEARADLARLAIIKQHRAEAQARREQEKKEKDDKAKKKAAT